MPQASIKHYFLSCRILQAYAQEMCKKANFLLFMYNAYTHMYMLSVRLSIKPPRLIYGIQTLSSGTDPPMCMFIQISNSTSQEFLNHGEDFFLSEVSGGLGSIWLCVFCGSFSLC